MSVHFESSFQISLAEMAHKKRQNHEQALPSTPLYPAGAQSLRAYSPASRNKQAFTQVMNGGHFPDCLNSAKASCCTCAQYTVTQLLLTEARLPHRLMLPEINKH
jgi:hypothetical protein